MVLNNGEFYNNFDSKTIADIVGDERLSKLELYVGDNLNNYIIENLPTILEKSMDDFLQTQLHEEKTIGEVFGGTLRITIDKNLYQITASLLRKLNNYAQENKDKVVSMIVSMVRAQLNFFVKMAYDLMNGVRLVRLDVLNI